MSPLSEVYPRKLANFAKAIMTFRTTVENERGYCKSTNCVQCSWSFPADNLKMDKFTSNHKLTGNPFIRAFVIFRLWSGESRRLIVKNRFLCSLVGPRYLITTCIENITELTIKCLFPCLTSETFWDCFCFENNVIAYKTASRSQLVPFTLLRLSSEKPWRHPL